MESVIMFNRLHVCVLAVVILICSSISAMAVAPTYQAKPGNATTGFVEVYDTNKGVEYGKARIQYSYWQDQTTTYWHYAYEIFNNEFFNTPTNFNDDYHFGWLKPTNPTATITPSSWDTINKFSIELDPTFTGYGPSDLAILDTQAGSSAGGGAWGHSPDPGNTGVDWTVSLGSGTPLPIAPTLQKVTKSGSGKNVVYTWSNYIPLSGQAAQTSRSDGAGSQYFEIASKWSPALREAAIGAGVNGTASGMVMAPGIAPSVVPEPSSLLTLFAASSFCGLAIIRRRRNS